MAWQFQCAIYCRDMPCSSWLLAWFSARPPGQPLARSGWHLLRLLAEHPDASGAAEALAGAAERQGDNVVELPVVIDYLLEMDSDAARAALRRLHESPRVAERAACAPVPAAGQTTRAAHGTVAELLAMFRAAGGSGGFARILSQDDRQYPAPFLDELADSLAAIAIAGRPEQPTAVTASLPTLALLTLKQANVGPNARIPYVGAFDRLRRVYLEASDPLIRIGALRHMVAVGNGDRGPPMPGNFSPPTTGT